MQESGRYLPPTLDRACEELFPFVSSASQCRGILGRVHIFAFNTTADGMKSDGFYGERSMQKPQQPRIKDRRDDSYHSYFGNS